MMTDAIRASMVSPFAVRKPGKRIALLATEVAALRAIAARQGLIK